MLVLVAAGFLCCWIPTWVFVLWFRFFPETSSRISELLVTFLFYLSVSINPIFTLSQMASSEGDFANCSVAAVKGQELCQRKLLRLLVTISSNERNKKQTFKSNEFVLDLKTGGKSYSLFFSNLVICE